MFLTTGHLSAETCRLLDEWSAGIDLAHRRDFSTAPIMIAPVILGPLGLAALRAHFTATNPIA